MFETLGLEGWTPQAVSVVVGALLGLAFGGLAQRARFCLRRGLVGAAEEPDEKIVRYMQGLYKRLRLQRIYFSAYQRGLGAMDLSAENKETNPADVLTREHRLYQVDFLMRKYGFEDSDIQFSPEGQLALDKDPKELWAACHPDFYPVNINRASRYELLRVPGLGPITVNRILKSRTFSRLHQIEDIGKPGKLLRKAAEYICF